MTRRHARLAALIVPLAAVAGLAACGDPSSSDVEDKLAEEVRKQAEERNLPVRFDDTVACPEGQDVSKGQKFTCTVGATENNVRVVYTISVTMTADDAFDYRITDVKVEAGSTAPTAPAETAPAPTAP